MTLLFSRVLVWLVLAIALGTFLGHVAHDVFVAQLINRERRALLRRAAADRDDALRGANYAAIRARMEQAQNEKRRSGLPEGESRDGAAEGMRAPGL